MATRWRDGVISNNEKEFVVKAIRSDHRVDGRRAFEHRPLQFQFASDDSSCIVRLGRTMAMATVSASLDAPYADRHSEGSVTFDVQPTAMAQGFGPDSQRRNEDAVELSRLVERGLKESRAVDLEALCVQPGRKVWHLQVDVRVLDACGNAADAAGLAALGALCVFRRPDATIDPDAPGGVVVHPTSQKEPLPLTLHHLPVPVTFAFFDGGDLIAVDPSAKEEAAAAGFFTVTMNPQGEVCAAQKARGVGVAPTQLLSCMRHAAEAVKGLTAKLRRALEAHEAERVAARVRRQRPGGEGAAAPAAAAPVAPALAAADVAKAGLPEDVRRIVEHAAAQDSSADEEDDEEESSEEEGEVAAAAAPVAAVPPAAEAMDVEDDEEEALKPVAAKPKAKSKPKEKETSKSKGKRRRAPTSGGGDGEEDTYAAIADMIVGAGGGGGAGGLEGALKRKTPK